MASSTSASNSAPSPERASSYQAIAARNSSLASSQNSLLICQPVRALLQALQRWGLCGRDQTKSQPVAAWPFPAILIVWFDLRHWEMRHKSKTICSPRSRISRQPSCGLSLPLLQAYQVPFVAYVMRVVFSKASYYIKPLALCVEIKAAGRFRLSHKLKSGGERRSAGE